MSKLFRYFNTQPFFNKPDDAGGGAGGGAGTEETTKTFSYDYVKSLREEASDYRKELKTQKKTNEDLELKFRGYFGLKAEDKVENWDTIFNTHKETQNKALADALAKSDEILVKAEMKALESKYDMKLVDKLIDKSKITIKDGIVTGLTEHLAELEKEYPQILKNQSGSQGANPGASSNTQTKTKSSIFDTISKTKHRK